ncbi:hypothetical protein [Streptomyces sp. Act143]|uniref:hypothetical protein n=1 Tax=Streptomyces sp. Act143 TaxID=2200760 RepID=UPI0026CC804F
MRAAPRSVLLGPQETGVRVVVRTEGVGGGGDSPYPSEWLSACRRLQRRYERKAERFPAFVGIAAALICYLRLTA